jgi:hypothetical protein
MHLNPEDKKYFPGTDVCTMSLFTPGRIWMIGGLLSSGPYGEHATYSLSTCKMQACLRSLEIA